MFRDDSFVGMRVAIYQGGLSAARKLAVLRGFPCVAWKRRGGRRNQCSSSYLLLQQRHSAAF
jgi:hypothetical protein